jgi:hypothetical protein
MEYIKSWFLIDLVSVIPFDLILMVQGANKLARFTRIGKFYKILRMIKMVRLLKVARVRNNIVKNLSEALKIGVGFERLLLLFIIFIVLVHVLGCIW